MDIQAHYPYLSTYKGPPLQSNGYPQISSPIHILSTPSTPLVIFQNKTFHFPLIAFHWPPIVAVFQHAGILVLVSLVPVSAWLYVQMEACMIQCSAVRTVPYIRNKPHRSEIGGDISCKPATVMGKDVDSELCVEIIIVG